MSFWFALPIVVVLSWRFRKDRAYVFGTVFLMGEMAFLAPGYHASTSLVVRLACCVVIALAVLVSYGLGNALFSDQKQ